MMVGDIVSWPYVNGICTGKIIEDLENGSYLVSTPNGKVVVVNKSSIIKK